MEFVIVSFNNFKNIIWYITIVLQIKRCCYNISSNS